MNNKNTVNQNSLKNLEQQFRGRSPDIKAQVSHLSRKKDERMFNRKKTAPNMYRDAPLDPKQTEVPFSTNRFQRPQTSDLSPPHQENSSDNFYRGPFPKKKSAATALGSSLPHNEDPNYPNTQTKQKKFPSKKNPFRSRPLTSLASQSAQKNPKTKQNFKKLKAFNQQMAPKAFITNPTNIQNAQNNELNFTAHHFGQIGLGSQYSWRSKTAQSTTLPQQGYLGDSTTNVNNQTHTYADNNNQVPQLSNSQNDQSPLNLIAYGMSSHNKKAKEIFHQKNYLKKSKGAGSYSLKRNPFAKADMCHKHGVVACGSDRDCQRQRPESQATTRAKFHKFINSNTTLLSSTFQQCRPIQKVIRKNLVNNLNQSAREQQITKAQMAKMSEEELQLYKKNIQQIQKQEEKQQNKRPFSASRYSAPFLQTCDESIKIIDIIEQRKMGFSFDEHARQLQIQKRMTVTDNREKLTQVVKTYSITTQICRSVTKSFQLLSQRAILVDLNIEGLQNLIIITFENPDYLEVQFCKNQQFDQIDQEFYGQREVKMDYRDQDKLKHVFFRVVNRGEQLKKSQMHLSFDTKDDNVRPLQQILNQKKKEQRNQLIYSVSSKDYQQYTTKLVEDLKKMDLLSNLRNKGIVQEKKIFLTSGEDYNIQFQKVIQNKRNQANYDVTRPESQKQHLRVLEQRTLMAHEKKSRLEEIDLLKKLKMNHRRDLIRIDKYEKSKTSIEIIKKMLWIVTIKQILILDQSYNKYEKVKVPLIAYNRRRRIFREATASLKDKGLLNGQIIYERKMLQLQHSMRMGAVALQSRTVKKAKNQILIFLKQTYMINNIQKKFADFQLEINQIQKKLRDNKEAMDNITQNAKHRFGQQIGSSEHWIKKSLKKQVQGGNKKQQLKVKYDVSVLSLIFSQKLIKVVIQYLIDQQMHIYFAKAAKMLYSKKEGVLVTKQERSKLPDGAYVICLDKMRENIHYESLSNLFSRAEEIQDDFDEEAIQKVTPRKGKNHKKVVQVKEEKNIYPEYDEEDELIIQKLKQLKSFQVLKEKIDQVMSGNRIEMFSVVMPVKLQRALIFLVIQDYYKGITYEHIKLRKEVIYDDEEL